MSDMNRKKIARKVADKYDITMAVAEKVLYSSLEIISDTLESGHRVMLHGFGTFKTKDMAARRGRNPMTGESVNISAKRIVKFSPGKNLKERVNTE